MPIAIKIENLSKQYRLGLVSTRTLSHDLNRWWQTSILGREDPYLKIGQENKLTTHHSLLTTHHSPEYVWALKDINLEVEEGEVLGIIGKNGAGKSTLLKILSKVTAPTTGTVKARGRIASLLEVGTGFHQEMTGRENIFMNGSIMGMTKTEIRKKFDEIVDFAGVERYIDTPVKRYSSGMTVRLGFAVAAFLEPEILVIDEVLAVGDAEFQKKAMGKMKEVSNVEGRTILFVSHNMSAVSLICQRVVILNNGTVIFEGTPDVSISYYLNGTRNSIDFKSKNNISLNEFVLIRKISIEPSLIEVFSKLRFELNIESRYINRISSLVLLIYNEWNQRVGIIDLRSTELTLKSTTLENITINGEINNFPGLPGIYKIGLYIESPYCNGDFLDLTAFEVYPEKEYNLIPYPQEVSGFYKLNSKYTIS
jgi:lipopolysaccharide transport system ATP-binding protein